MRYDQKLKEVGIRVEWVALYGVLFLATTFALYLESYLAVTDVKNKPSSFEFDSALWLNVIIMHVLVGVLVALDNSYTAGKVWQMQVVIMASAASITVLVFTSFIVNLLGRASDPASVSLTKDPRVYWPGLSLITSLAGDALLLATLFAYFHLRIDTLPITQSTPSYRTPTTAKRAYIGKYAPMVGAEYVLHRREVHVK